MYIAVLPTKKRWAFAFTRFLAFVIHQLSIIQLAYLDLSKKR